jgi:glycosyltransferase involved in cell wall biosynthesis
MSVSVITPMYNEALNIKKCYLTLCQQKNIKFEWVVIDDGSTDMSTDILRNLMAAHDNENFTITLIEQKNAGAAAARQAGITCCKFDIITILDADDKFSEDALAKAFSKVIGSVDIVCYKVKFTDYDNNHLSDFKYKPHVWPILGRMAFSECIDGWGLAGWFMIKKTIILQAYKYVNSLGTDSSFNLDELVSRLCMFYAQNIEICDGVYFYYKNPNSTTNKINQNYYKVIWTSLELNKFIISQGNLDWLIKSQKNLLSTIWGVYIRYIKWHSTLVNPQDWLVSLHKLSNEINIPLLLKENMKIKQRAKVYIKILLTLYLRSKI